MRVCEYFPFAIASYEDRKIDIIEQAYFESDYCEYEADELAEQIEALKKDEVKIEVAQNAAFGKDLSSFGIDLQEPFASPWKKTITHVQQGED